MILRNFVVLEGADGTGTSTQLKILNQQLTNSIGIDTHWLTYEPTDSSIGKLIRSGLRIESLFCPDTLARLFAADRGEHIHGKGGIVERCSQGVLVVSDRYVPSSLIYQGLICTQGLPESLNAPFPYPELILYFTLPASLAAQRYHRRGERDHYERLDFQEQVHDRYERILPEYAREGGSRLVRIDATQDIEGVAKQVWSALRELPICKG